jgi:hypothetical protein
MRRRVHQAVLAACPAPCSLGCDWVLRRGCIRAASLQPSGRSSRHLDRRLGGVGKAPVWYGRALRCGWWSSRAVREGCREVVTSPPGRCVRRRRHGRLCCCDTCAH